MEIIYYKDPLRNFGDDLNEWIWSSILPTNVLAAADVALVGIGSILNERVAARQAAAFKRVFVLGSGASYGAPPRDISQWEVLAVRGPLTASVVGRPNAAITDGAILLSLVPSLLPKRQTRKDVLFIPHHKSLDHSDWPAAAAAAGLRFLSPRSNFSDVLAAMAKAKLVIAEAMHGAIVADTLRIPWIPVALSPAVDAFKWSDWTRSMSVAYRPTQIPTSTFAEFRWSRGLRHRVPRHAGLEDGFGEPNSDALHAFLINRYSHLDAAATRSAAAPSRKRLLSTLAEKIIVLDPIFRERAARVLRRVAEATPYLSDDLVFERRLEQMQDAVRRLSSSVNSVR
jgi:succinoglycan biosynthesis protein ExoV